MTTHNNLHTVELSAADVHTATKHNQENDVPSDKESGHLYEDVLDVIGFGKVQWIILGTCGLLLMMVINETMGMSIITIASQCDLETNSMDKAVMSAASFVGIFCSSYFWGFLSDTVSRKVVLMYTTFAGNLFSFLSIFVPNFWVYVVMRFLVGFFIAGASSTTYAFLSEFFMPRHRPVVLNYTSMFVGLSAVYVPATAWLVLSMNWSFEIFGLFTFRPWRLLPICHLLPGLLASCILIKLPESPKILLALRKDTEAYTAINWIAQCNTGKALSDFKIDKIKNDEQRESETLLITSKSPCAILKKMWRETRPLFRRPHVFNFVISCTVMSGIFFSSSGMGLWFPEIQNRLGSNTADHDMTICEVIDDAQNRETVNATSNVCNDVITTKTYIDTISFGASLIVGYLILGIVINPLGRKLTIISALTIGSACSLALLWIRQPIVLVVCFCLYLLLPGLCVSVLSGAVVDLVPTHLRGKAVCICLMLGRSGSVIGSNIIGVLLETYCRATFGVFSGFVLLCASLTFLLPI